MSRARVVVVGASLAGVRTVQALRAAGFSGHIVLVGAEKQLPYDRPPLSKAVLRAGADAAAPILLTAEQVDQLDIDLRLGRRAEHLDPAASAVHLDDGATLHYDDLVVATGSRARHGPWAASAGVQVLRTLEDAAALRARLRTGSRLAVVGAGFVGAEVAATATALGVSVTMLDPLSGPMARVLGDEVAAGFASLHRSHGVATRFGVTVDHVRVNAAALSIVLADGETLTADTVLVGIGAVPETDWLAGSGLSVEDGLLCDERCRALGAPRVHAVGDVARWWHPRHGRHVRLEHWTNAVEQASFVAHDIAHPDATTAYAPVEYVWSDQYDRRIQIAGCTGSEPALVVGEPAGERFVALYGDGAHQLTGVVAVNHPRLVVAARRALARGVPVADFRELAGL